MGEQWVKDLNAYLLETLKVLQVHLMREEIGKDGCSEDQRQRAQQMIWFAIAKAEVAIKKAGGK